MLEKSKELCPFHCPGVHRMAMDPNQHHHCQYCLVAITWKNAKRHMLETCPASPFGAKATQATQASQPRSDISQCQPTPEGSPGSGEPKATQVTQPRSEASQPEGSNDEPQDTQVLWVPPATTDKCVATDEVDVVERGVGPERRERVQAFIPRSEFVLDEWVPRLVCCAHHGKEDNQSCKWVKKKFVDRKVYDVDGMREVNIRHYQCTTHATKERDALRSLYHPDVLKELASTPRATINAAFLPVGKEMVTQHFALGAWHQFVDNGFNIAKLERQTQVNYNVVAAIRRGSHWPAGTKPEPTPQGPIQHAERHKGPKAKVLTRLMGALHAFFSERIPSIATNAAAPVEEGLVMRWDGTYGCANTIGVMVAGTWTQFAYCLSTWTTTSGQVGDLEFLSSESSEAMRPQCMRALRKNGRAPRFMFSDDI